MTLLKKTALLLGGALALSSAPVLAQSDAAAANRADAQCLAMFTLAFSLDEASEVDDEAKTGGMVLVGYYLGRIDARDPNVDLSVLLQDVITNDMADETKMTEIATRCGTEAMAMADRMSKAGESMQSVGDGQ